MDGERKPRVIHLEAVFTEFSASSRVPAATTDCQIHSTRTYTHAQYKRCKYARVTE